MTRNRLNVRATMTATGLLIALEARGILVARVQGELLIFPRTLMLDEERQLRECRAELLELAEAHEELLVAPIPALARWYAGLSAARRLAFGFAVHKRVAGESCGLTEAQRKVYKALLVVWGLADNWSAIPL